MTNQAGLAKYIDHTLLKPEASTEAIVKTCEEAIQFGFFGVCVNSSFISLVAQKLQGASVAPVAVIGFPLGAMSTAVKSFEADYCVRNGAKEIDMVLSIGKLKEKDYSAVLSDIMQVVRASGDALVKVILETALLTNEEKEIACKLSVDAGAKFVKTCTGFGGGSANVEDIQLMRRIVGPNFGVKASGGIKSREVAEALIRAGANRLGTSSGVALVQGQAIGGGY
jgi:deoxyribose-phosphate aldolase